MAQGALLVEVEPPAPQGGKVLAAEIHNPEQLDRRGQAQFAGDRGDRSDGVVRKAEDQVGPHLAREPAQPGRHDSRIKVWEQQTPRRPRQRAQAAEDVRIGVVDKPGASRRVVAAPRRGDQLVDLDAAFDQAFYEQQFVGHAAAVIE